MRLLPSVALLLISSAAGAQEGAAPKFIEETATSGISTRFEGDWEFMVGGGAAAFDCNADGFDEVLIAGGAAKSTLHLNTSTRGGALTFKEAESGLEFDAVLGTYPFDADGDGRMDVMLLRQGENLLMRGLGECRFERANEAWNYPGGEEWSTAFSATWEQGADWPTIAVGNYVNRKEEFSPWGSCTANFLHRPESGARKFAAPVALKPSFCPLSMLFTDWNRSGTPSLRVSNDREYYEGGQEQMWHVAPGEAPRLYTEAEGWKRLRIWGMGIASTDLDGDTYPEYFLTSMADQKLQTLAAPAAPGKSTPDYKDVAWPKGVTAHRPHTGEDLRPSTGWHAQFADVDNDGRADLFVAKGNVDAMPDFAAHDPNNLFMQNVDGTFTDKSVAAGVASTKTSRGGALADFNLDGLLDLVVVNRREGAQVWRNVSTGAGHWLQVRVTQPGPNRDAIGGWLEVRRGDIVTRKELTVGGGQASGQLGWHHMGLGEAANAEIRVIWPHGDAGPWQKVEADRFYALDAAAGISEWQPQR